MIGEAEAQKSIDHAWSWVQGKAIEANPEKLLRGKDNTSKNETSHYSTAPRKFRYWIAGVG